MVGGDDEDDGKVAPLRGKEKKSEGKKSDARPNIPNEKCELKCRCGINCSDDPLVDHILMFCCVQYMQFGISVGYIGGNVVHYLRSIWSIQQSKRR